MGTGIAPLSQRSRCLKRKRIIARFVSSSPVNERFRNRSAGLVHLDRDDRGMLNDTIEIDEDDEDGEDDER